jgi:predicted ferric reductase
MNRTIVGAFWLVVYLIVILSPLFVMMIRPTPPQRSFWVEFSVGLGFVGLVQTAVQFALIARYKTITAPYGIDLILKYHRQVATIAIGLLLAHPVILVIANPALLGLLNPIGGTMASRAGNWALYTFILLALLSYFRKRIDLDYELWRVTHLGLALIAIVLSHVHIRLSAYYTETPWKHGVLIGISVAMFGSLVYLRLVKPALLRRRPYRVAEIRPERGDTWSLTLTARDHEGMRFKPGQFAWIKLGASPYTVEEHPFSFSSSALEPRRLEFGIKELGDFTSGIGDVPIGTAAYLDGPHGAFSPDLEPAAGYVFYAGGVGITPFMSMLRTLADRGDKRPLLLFYGDKSWEATAFTDALAELEQRLDLTIVYVLEEPPEGWDGEEGFIDAGVLERHLPDEGIERLHLICGPEPMLDAVEQALEQREVPMRLIRFERFGLV